ncbi:unnamed protein product [Adineta ricciae]|uniref:LIM zinc-binding domain-containing protein n=1 Tax=Adineta ricciae TaxID=249248 RepID=A0A813MLJ2_ADIRI|nr:unnamed protein product [Adineta ricciae]
MSDFHEEPSIDDGNESEDALERLRNITEMFSAKSAKDEKQQQLSKVEKFVPSEKIKNTFQKFEDIGASNGHFQRDDDDEDENDNDDEGIRPNGVIRSARIKKASKEHVPYHEMAEVKDKFEKGLVDVNKPRAEKRLDFRIQSGLTSSKKQAFEQGEFEQEVESHVNKIQIETDLVAGLTSSKKQAFEQQQQQQHMENDANQMNRTIIMERDALIGVAMEKKAKFESGELAADRPKISGRPDEIETIVGSGLAQAKRSEILSKIENEQQVQRSTDRVIDIDTEQGLAIARREQLASLANSEFKSTEKHIDVTAGLATAIKEQYIADASKVAATVTKAPVVTNDIESGLAKNRAIVFEKPDETTVRRTVDIDSELRERGVAKERVAMFKNLENGSQSSTNGGSGDTKIRVDEHGNVVRESDKCEEIYFEKGQTKQLVEQWKTKQNSPDRETSEPPTISDTEIVQQGKAKHLVQMWKSIDKENTPPPERRGLRAFTPPADNERRLPPPSDNEETDSHTLNCTDDKASIESGYAKAVRERREMNIGFQNILSITRTIHTNDDEFLQNAEQNNTISKRKTLKQITPPPESPSAQRRKSSASPTDGVSTTDSSNNTEEIISIKGQTKSLKSRFIELEQDAMKVETASSKIKYVPKRFVNTPAPKQLPSDAITDPTKCSACNKTVYAMEKIEADKKVYHKSCFKCMHCKSILKLGNYTANDGQIYCKPHFLQLFAIKGNYSEGFGLNDHKTRWSATNGPESTSFTEN